MDQIRRPKSLGDLVIERLRQAITEGRYGLGEPLSELRLATELGTSKGPVRRAILLLQAEGLVRVVPQSGTFVFSLGAEEVRRLNQYRFILEEAALRLALNHDAEALAARLQELFAAMVRARKAADLRTYLALDTKFHDAIFAHCGNEYLADAYRAVSGKSAALRTHLSTKPHQTGMSFEEHRKIAEAVARADFKTAAKILKVHIGRAAETYNNEVGDIAAFDRNSKE